MLSQNERAPAALGAAKGSENLGSNTHIDSQEYNHPHPEKQATHKRRCWSFAERAAAAAFGRSYIPPRYRGFVDVSPQQSLAARKAVGFSDHAAGADLASAFETALREMGATP